MGNKISNSKKKESYTKNSNDNDRESCDDQECFNPYLGFGNYIYGLVGTFVANQINHFFKDQQKAEI